MSVQSAASGSGRAGRLLLVRGKRKGWTMQVRPHEFPRIGLLRTANPE
jgi:hypothetical protein